MIDYIKSILPRIKKHSKELCYMSFVDKKWILIDDKENKTEYEFCRNDIISIDGEAIKAGWEFKNYYNPKEVYIKDKIEYGRSNEYNQAFVSDGLLILSKKNYSGIVPPDLYLMLYNKDIIIDGDIKTYLKQFLDFNFTIVDKCNITLDKDISLLVEFLKGQLLKLKCSCAIAKQKNENWSDLKDYLAGYDDDISSYEVNFAKGFFYWVTNEQEKAYVYLTKAIQLNPLCDISYNLRAVIDNKISPDNIKDAYKAVALNPSARNYFVLGTVLEKGNEITEEILSYYKKTVEFDCNFYHASTNISTYYINIKNYDKSLFYLETAKENNPQAWGVYEHLGYLYRLMNNYIKSIEHYNIYINRIGDTERIKKGKRVRKIVVNEAWELGINQLKLKNYAYGVSLINSCLSGGGYNHFKTLINNLFKNKKENIFNEITTAQLKEKMDKGTWVEINGIETYREAECDGYAYIHNENIKINISKLKLYRNDSSIGYKYDSHCSICTFEFGKYKNELTIDVIIKDPSYILWCIRNLNNFTISNALVAVLLNIENIKITTLLLDSIEINLIKLNLIELYNEMLQEDEENSAAALNERPFGIEYNDDYYEDAYDRPTDYNKLFNEGDGYDYEIDW